MTNGAIVFVVALAMAVGVGVGLLLRRRRSTSSSPAEPVAPACTALVSLAQDAGRAAGSSLVIEALDEARAETLLLGAAKLDGSSRMSSDVARIVGPAVQLAIGAAPAAAQHGKFLVGFTAKGTLGLGSKSLDLMKHGNKLQPTLVVAKGLRGSGTVVENATIAGAASKHVANAAAVAHLAIVLAVQMQLVSMERALERIEKAVSGLQDKADDQFVARVSGRLKALAFLRDEMSADTWTEHDRQRWLTALDQAYTEFHQVADLAVAQCARAEADIKSSPVVSGFLSSTGETLASKFSGGVAWFRHHLDLRTLCAIGQLVTVHLRNGLGAPTAAAELAATLSAIDDQARAHARLVEERSVEFAAKFRSVAWETEKRKAWMEGARVFAAEHGDTVARIREQLAMLTPGGEVAMRAIIDIGADGAVRSTALLTR